MCHQLVIIIGGGACLPPSMARHQLAIIIGGGACLLPSMICNGRAAVIIVDSNRAGLRHDNCHPNTSQCHPHLSPMFQPGTAAPPVKSTTGGETPGTASPTRPASPTTATKATNSGGGATGSVRPTGSGRECCPTVNVSQYFFLCGVLPDSERKSVFFVWSST